MVDILAVGGFWLVILCAVLRRPIMMLVEKSSVQNADVKALNDRINNLESLVLTISQENNTLNKEISELKESAEFSYKLLDQQQGKGGGTTVNSAARAISTRT